MQNQAVFFLKRFHYRMGILSDLNVLVSVVRDSVRGKHHWCYRTDERTDTNSVFPARIIKNILLEFSQ